MLAILVKYWAIFIVSSATKGLEKSTSSEAELIESDSFDELMKIADKGTSLVINF